MLAACGHASRFRLCIFLLACLPACAKSVDLCLTDWHHWLQLSTYVSWWTADIFGRKALFIQAGFQMSIALIVVAVSLKTLGTQGVWMAWYILAVICVYDM